MDGEFPAVQTYRQTCETERGRAEVDSVLETQNIHYRIKKLYSLKEDLFGIYGSISFDWNYYDMVTYHPENHYSPWRYDSAAPQLLCG